MAFEITGRLIEKYETQTVSDKFKKREFVVEYRDNPNSSFTEMIKFQLTQERCTLIDPMSIGQEVRVFFNLRGRKWEKDGNVSYFTNLEGWKVELVSAQGSTPPATLPDPSSMPGLTEEASDDLPF
ncbi:MAG: DUF3127 domain-containing protein [Bacteroidales bacterium]|nr:DUF3127 domain-containing protein [Bacteroidales bacterium]